MKKITIVGGGTAAWSCAAALSCNKNLQIILISSTASSSIGVGESSLPLIRNFHKKFKLFQDENWLDSVNATIKYTLEFENFIKESGSKWVHPLTNNKEYEQFMTLKYLSKVSHLDLTNRFFYAQNLRNKKFTTNENNNLNLGAYHFDAHLYSKRLKQIAIKRGVEYIDTNVQYINQEGDITKSLHLYNGDIVYSDLFIDCTGFQNLVIKNLESSKFISFENRLFCNKAITLKLPYNDFEKQKVNATIAKGLKNGWVWHIPLNDVIAFGYVYSSNHTNQEDAKIEFLEYLENEFKYSKIKEEEIHYVDYRSGVYEKSWVGNNIAIGLSSFFIEPLESTGIALFHIQIMELAKILETNPAFFQNYKSKYNDFIYQNIQSVKSFIEMHYITSCRDDTTFWKDASSIEPNKVQKEILKLFNEGLYQDLLTYELGGIFSTLSWLHLLCAFKESSA